SSSNTSAAAATQSAPSEGRSLCAADGDRNSSSSSNNSSSSSSRVYMRGSSALFPRVRSLRQLQYDVGAVLCSWRQNIYNWAAAAAANAGVGSQEGGLLQHGETAVVLGKVFWALDKQQQQIVRRHRQ